MKVCIVSAADKNYIEPFKALYNSIKQNSSDYEIYLLAHGTKEDFKELESIVNIIYNRETKKYPGSSIWKEEIPAMYSRMLIPEIFKDYDRVLWLDADIVVLKNLHELFNIDLSNYPCAGTLVGRPMSPVKLNYQKYMPHQLDEPDNYPEYKNTFAIQAGVVLFDIKKWNELKLTDKMNDIFDKDIKFKFVVQGLLGAVLEGNFKVLDFCWNFKPSFQNLGIEPKIVHFISAGSKPWLTKVPGYKLWEEYYNKGKIM